MAALSVPAAGSEADWPQWLGPQRDGTVQAAVVPWGPEGPAERWRRPGGEGFSSLAIADARVFTMWTEKQREYLVALDAADGRLLWQHVTGGKYFEPQGGNGPRSTPAVHDGLVHAVGATGLLVTVRAETGQLVWSVDLPTAFGTRLPSWGFSGSPLVDGDRMLVETGGTDGRALTAFDRRTGDVVWSVGSDGLGYSSPTILDLAGLRQALFFTAAGLVAVAPADGRLLWRHAWPTPYGVNAATPVPVPPDGVFISSAYDQGGALLRVAATGADVEARTAWKTASMRNHMATSVVFDGHLYGFDNALLKCIAADSGQERWKARGYGRGSLLLAGDILVVLSDTGDLALVRAGPDAHEELARAPVLSRRCWTVPALAGGHLYLRDDREVVSIDVSGR